MTDETNTRAPASGAVEALRTICQRMADDFQSSENHHPNHVLVSRADFDAMVAALTSSPKAEEADDLQKALRRVEEWLMYEAEPGTFCAIPMLRGVRVALGSTTEDEASAALFPPQPLQGGEVTREQIARAFRQEVAKGNADTLTVRSERHADEVLALLSAGRGEEGSESRKHIVEEDEAWLDELRVRFADFLGVLIAGVGSAFTVAERRAYAKVQAGKLIDMISAARKGG